MALNSEPCSLRFNGRSGSKGQTSPLLPEVVANCLCSPYHSYPTDCITKGNENPVYLCVEASSQLFLRSESWQDGLVLWRSSCIWSHKLPCCFPQPQVPLPSMISNSSPAPQKKTYRKNSSTTFVFMKEPLRKLWVMILCPCAWVGFGKRASGTGLHVWVCSSSFVSHVVIGSSMTWMDRFANKSYKLSYDGHNL